jgi:hypothetical protein
MLNNKIDLFKINNENEYDLYYYKNCIIHYNNRYSDYLMRRLKDRLFGIIIIKYEKNI